MRANRLIHEQSPYLLQHAHNPVDWYPWGTEAQDQAKKDDLPLFVSIGYAACHWCHVMERECFMDEEVAALLNADFIPVKVDREEHPEIDRIYMTACQLMTGSGGWPLSVFLTPDLRPFYAATFIPRMSGRGMPGMLDLLPYLATIWKERRNEVYDAGDRVFMAMQGSRGGCEEPPGERGADLTATVHDAYHALEAHYDTRFGGFGKAPKFPSIPQILFLFRYGETFQVPRATEMALNTLQAMSRGGIRDHIGYGFHRYATDQAWMVPHFEKMLYDQTCNAIAFTTAFQVAGNEEMREAAEECMEYLMITLARPGGGFASAEDADSPGGEGAFYLWRAQEMRSILTSEEYRIAEQEWGIREQGNIPPGSGIEPGYNIIARSMNLQTRGEDEQRHVMIPEIRRKLYTVRDTRARPLLDDKILTDWNGMAIEALATAGMVFRTPRMIQAAEATAGWIRSFMVAPDGTLLHRWRGGSAAITGTAGDYIFLASGLLRLFQATGRGSCLSEAIRITNQALHLFWDEERGGLYATRDDDPGVPLRLRDEYDGPVPAVNGQAYLLLRDLALITGEEQYTREADALLAGMRDVISRSPSGTLTLLGGVCRERKEIRAMITGEPDDPRYEALMQMLCQRFIPGLCIVPVIPASAPELATLIPDLPVPGTGLPPSVQICAAHTCHPPVSDPEDLNLLLDRLIRS